MERRLALIKDGALTAAAEACGLLRRRFGHVAGRPKGSAIDLVTDADLESQALLQARLAAVAPQAAFLGEEGAAPVAGGAVRPGLDAPALWVVDPLDGTTNFAHGVGHCAVSIAYAEHGRVLVGVVQDVLRGERFAAVAGRGATLDGVPCRVSAAASWSAALVATGFFYERGPLMRRTLASVERLLVAGAADVRRLGSAALDACWVACGRYGAYFEYRLNAWDFAAATLIAAEAGARVSDPEGRPLDLGAAGVACAAPALHPDLLRLIAPAAAIE